MKKAMLYGLLVGLVVFVQSTVGYAKELSFASHFGTKNEILLEVLQPWAEKLEAATNGDLTVKFYPGQTLAKTADEYDAVVYNIADMSWNQHAFNKGRFPAMSVLELPFLVPSTEVGAKTINALYQQFPEIRKEHDDVHLLYLWATLSAQLHTIKKPVTSLEDLKGMKLACTPGAAKTVQALGAIPVPLPPPKMYETLEKGVADGVVLAWAAFKVWKLEEVTKYHTKTDIGAVTAWSAMNKDVWNDLSKEQQVIIDDLSKDLALQNSAVVTKHRDMALERFKNEGHEFYELTAVEKQRWIEKTSNIREDWIKAKKRKGLPAEELVEAAEKLVKEYSN